MARAKREYFLWGSAIFVIGVVVILIFPESRDVVRKILINLLRNIF